MKRVIGVLVVALTLLTTGTVLGASVVPTVIPGANNDGKTCAEAFPGTIELKFDNNPQSGTLATVNGGSITIVRPSTVDATNANSIDFSSDDVTILGVVVKDGVDGANAYDYRPNGVTSDTYLTTPFDGDKGISHVNFCYLPDEAEEADALTVTKNAAGSYDVTYSWEIDKSAESDEVFTVGGAAADVDYTVTVSHGDGAVSGVEVSGTITVTNPNAANVVLDSVSDSLSDETTCDVDDSDLTIEPGANNTFSYTCELTELPSGTLTNHVEIVWSDQTLSDESELEEGSAEFDSQAINFSVDTTTDECVAVGDDIHGVLDADLCVGEANPAVYEYTESVDGPAGTCTDNDNEASFTTKDSSTSDSDTWTVVDCQGADLIVTKTVTPSFDRAFDWDLEKSVDESYIELLPGDDHATFNYTVTLSHDAGTDSNWSLAGVITVENPNDWQEVTLDSLTDSIDNGGDCTLEVSGPYVVPAADEDGNGELEVGYTCVYDDAPTSADFTNTATATWNAATYNTPAGTDDGTADGAFDEPTNVTDDCVDATDTIAGELGEVCVGDEDLSFEYSNNVPNPGLGHCVQVDNTASFTSNNGGDSGEDSESVDVCTYNASLTIGYWKTHMHQCAARERQATGGCSNNGPFTRQYLPQTLGNYSVNTEAKALAIFNGNNCSNLSAGSNALACLAAQLLGTKLNIANTSNPSCISATIAAADAFLISKSYAGPGSYTLTAAQRATAISLKTALDNYNNTGC